MKPFYIHIKVEPAPNVRVDRELLLGQLVEEVREKAGKMAHVSGQIGHRNSYNDLMDIEDLSEFTGAGWVNMEKIRYKDGVGGTD